MEQTGRRKLAAILMADVVEYGRHMGEDEPGTIRTLKAHRAIFAEHIQQRNGRVVDAKGDAIMAEFASVVDAVAAAVEIQRETEVDNGSLSGERRMWFRIGINLGDVVEEPDSIYGDGVTVAARLETLAEPGGICVSRAAHDQAIGKLPLEFEYLGEHPVKTQTVRAYKVVVPEGAKMPAPGQTASRIRRWRSPGYIVAAVIIVALAGVGVFSLTDGGSSSKVAPSENDADLAAAGGLPTIAVLPFDNLSVDPDQDYFADGITEELITLLAQFRDLSVIARNSMFTYKGRAVDVRTVGVEMGADYVLEGSVRRSADRIRLTAQLLSATDGKHMWAENFDRQLTATDLFALQDEIAEGVVAAIAGAYGQISMEQLRESSRLPPSEVTSYECVLRVFAYHRQQSPATHLDALNCLERAVTVDPKYGEAWAWAAFMNLEAHTVGFNRRPDSFERAKLQIDRATALDPLSPAVLWVRAYELFAARDPQFFEVAREAVQANSRDGYIIGQIGGLVAFAGHWEEGRALVERGQLLSQIHPGWWHWPLAHERYLNGDYQRAFDTHKKANLPEYYWHHVILAMDLGQLGRTEEAGKHLDELRRLYPNFEKAAYTEFQMWIWNSNEIEHFIDGLRKAGLAIPKQG